MRVRAAVAERPGAGITIEELELDFVRKKRILGCYYGSARDGIPAAAHGRPRPRVPLPHPGGRSAYGRDAGRSDSVSVLSCGVM